MRDKLNRKKTFKYKNKKNTLKNKKEEQKLTKGEY